MSSPFPTRGAALLPALIVATLLTALAPPAALAEESSENTATEPAENSEDITVKTVAPTNQSVEDTRFPSGFVTQVELEGATGRGEDLGDALEQVAGVNVRRSAGVGQPAFASVRGGNSRQLAVSLNGMRIGAPAGIGFDVGSLSLAGIDSAEVYKGPAGTVHGAGALSGALNLRTRLPRGRGTRVGAEALYGAFGTYGLSAHSAHAHPDYAFRFDAGWRQSEGDFDFIDPQGVAHRRVNNDHHQLGLNGAGRVSLGRHELSPVVLYEVTGGGAPGPSEFQQRYRDARLHQNRLIGQLGWERRAILAGDWGVADARARAGYQRRATDYKNPHAFPGDSHVHNDSLLQTLAVNAETGIWLAFGDMIHARLEGRRELYDDTNRTAYSASYAASSIDAGRTTFAAALSNELFVFDEALSLVAGLRAEFIRDEANQTTASTPAVGAPRPDASTELEPRTWTPLIPSVGAIWRARTWLEFKANLARTYRAPDFDELYLDMVGIRGDAGLKPERALTWDAGVQLGSRKTPASAELVWFESRIDESIYFVARTAYLFEAANLGSGQNRGVEATVNLHPHDRFSLNATYTWTHARLDAMPADAQIPGQPVHQTRAAAEVELAGPGALGALEKLQSLRLFTRADWRSRVYLDSFGNIYNPAFWSLDTGAAVAPTDWVELTLNLRNLTDNQRGADTLQRPLPGRAFYMSLKVDFDGID